MPRYFLTALWDDPAAGSMVGPRRKSKRGETGSVYADDRRAAREA